MNTIPREVQHLGATDCFVYKGGIYTPSNYTVQYKLYQSLPTVAAKYEQLLIDNNIAYNKLEGGECEIYDKDCYETEELTLPVYVFHAIKGTYIYTGKEHAEKALTKESIDAARDVERTVEALISKANSEANFKELDEKVKSLLGKNAIAFIPALSPIALELGKFQSELCEKNRYFISSRCSKVGYGRYFGYIIVDLKEAEEKTVLNVDVPKNLVGLFIGAGGQNIKTLINGINEFKPIHINRINVHKIASN